MIADTFHEKSATDGVGSHPFQGMYVIARCHSAGVHAGEVISVDGKNAILKDSTRLWYWKGKGGVALSGVAQFGVSSESKLDTKNPLLYVTDICEMIPCSKIAEESIRGK